MPPITNSSDKSPKSDLGPPSPEGPKEDPTRCFVCSRKVGLLGFKCRCSHVYCSRHRYAEEHGCIFDYKKMEQEKLRKANPVITSPKAPPI